MLSLQQQKEIETAPATDKRNYLAYLDAGFKICRYCEKFIRWPGRRCPFCHKQLRTKPRATKSRRRYHEVRASGQKLVISYERPRTCSQCGSDKTGKLKSRGNGIRQIPHWMKDGKGGHLCNRCYQKKRKVKAKASGLESQDKELS
jgi:hypothetical protein